MKNLFKKSKKQPVEKTQILDNNQLAKVIGGTELISDGGVNTGAHKRPGVL